MPRQIPPRSSRPPLVRNSTNFRGIGGFFSVGTADVAAVPSVDTSRPVAVMPNKEGSGSPGGSFSSATSVAAARKGRVARSSSSGTGCAWTGCAVTGLASKTTPATTASGATGCAMITVPAGASTASLTGNGCSGLGGFHRRLITVRGEPRHHLAQDCRQAGWHFGTYRLHIGRFAGQPRTELLDHAAAAEGGLPREQEVQGAAQAVNVGTNVRACWRSAPAPARRSRWCRAGCRSASDASCFLHFHSATGRSRGSSRPAAAPAPLGTVTMRLLGLMSRWTMPRSSACCRPSAAWRAYSAAS